MTTIPHLHQANFRYTLEPNPEICDEVSGFFKEIISIIPAIWLQDEGELGNPYDSEIKAHGLFYFTVIRDTCSAIESKRIKAGGLTDDMNEFLFNTTDDDKEYLRRATVHLRNKTGYMHEAVKQAFYWVVLDEPPPFYRISKNIIKKLISMVKTGKEDSVMPKAVVAAETVGVPMEAEESLKKRKA